MTIASRAAIGTAFFLAFFAPSFAGVVVTFDAATINDLISSVSVKRIEVPLMEDQVVEVVIDELTVLGFVPASEGNHEGYIRTRLELRAPQLGFRLAVNPRLALDVVEVDSHSMLELRFQSVELPLAFTTVNLAPMLPPIRYPADADFLLDGATGDVEVTSRVTDVSMTPDLIRFEISLEVTPPAPQGAAPSD